MRYILVTLGSFLLSSLVIYNTYSRKKQFYPTVVYLSNHQPCLAILLFQCVVLLFIFVRILTYIFFGRLQRTEVDNLVSQSWYAFFDMCLVLAFFQEELGTEFLFLFSVLLFVRAFHWLIEERIDYMERTPVINALFHVRVATLIAILTQIDLYFVGTAYIQPATRGVSVRLALGIEYLILLINLFSTTVRYILHSIDSMREHAWDKKAMYLLYVDIIVGFLRLGVYVDFTIKMWALHPFPLFIARPIYLSLRSLKKAIRDVLMSRRAISYMNTEFRDASAEDLAASSDTVCIICREEMRVQPNAATQNPTSVLKRLPCSHIFHVGCLRSWFQRQQTCPTCRMDVIRRARQQELQRQQRQPDGSRSSTATPTSPTVTTASATTTATTAPTIAQNMVPPWMPPFYGYPPMTNGSQTQGSNPPNTAMPPPFMMPPFMGMPIVFPGNLLPSFTSPMPRPPQASPESADEARLRASAEARFTALRQINVLLNAAVLQMNAYLNAVSEPEDVNIFKPELNSKSSTDSLAVIVDQNEDAKPVPAVSSETGLEDSANENSTPNNSEDPELVEVRKRRLERFCSKTNDLSGSNQSCSVSGSSDD